MPAFENAGIFDISFPHKHAPITHGHTPSLAPPSPMKHWTSATKHAAPYLPSFPEKPNNSSALRALRIFAPENLRRVESPIYRIFNPKRSQPAGFSIDRILKAFFSAAVTKDFHSCCCTTKKSLRRCFSAKFFATYSAAFCDIKRTALCFWGSSLIVFWLFPA